MSLSNELKNSISSNPNATGRMQLIANLSEIKIALDDGYTRTIIWKHLSNKKQVTVSYKRFTKILSELLKASKAEAPKAEAPKAEADEDDDIYEDDSRFDDAIALLNQHKTFIHNPIADKNLLK